jgi:quercetin dioxygenase-like cupin family protein
LQGLKCFTKSKKSFLFKNNDNKGENIMAVIKQAEVVKEEIGVKRHRYLTHTDSLMMVVIDFEDGPTSEPDPPHSHPHEQISYVASGEVLFFLDGVPTKLIAGDMVTVPPDVPHSVQLLTASVRLVDTFTPLREDFMSV